MGGRRPSTKPDGHIRIGQIVGPFGLKGVVKVQPLTDFEERFEPGAPIFIDSCRREILSCHWQKGQVRLLLEGVGSCEEADALRWKYVTVPASDRPTLGEGEYLSADLVGLRVFEGGREIGRVEDVIKAPAHDLLKVGGTLIPAVSEFVKRVDLDEGVIEVELIDGLRPEETS
ncbi:MAG: 16S rRNA processing protein RimM [Armatimonadetes bacterium]|nr:16S rRNA processing protein RimM [Armatimonadota bacterium]